MLSGLQEEIDKYANLSGASPKIIMNFLNNLPAVVEEWKVCDEHTLKVPKGDMLALLSSASRIKLFDWMEAKSTDSKGFLLFYNAHDQFKTADPVFRSIIQSLHTPLALITEDEKNAILRLGECKKTRTEELFGRLITKEDF